MTATLITAPSNPLGTLYYVWKQSRINGELPTPAMIENLMLEGSRIQLIFNRSTTHSRIDDICQYADLRATADALGYDGAHNRGVIEAANHVRDELMMILNESIPVVENLHFVFHLRNIPISLREQLVRHRIGTAIDPRVGADIIPEPLQALMREAPAGSFMEMKVVPDLAESTFWSQTSRVIPFSDFYDAGRFVLPASLEGKTVKLNKDVFDYTGVAQEIEVERPAKDFYLETLETIQEAYKALQEAGVHIEDCRNIIPVGATHDITWGLNLKALLHIFGKRSSWIAQVGIWEQVMMQMAEQLVEQVHPMFRMVLQPQCIKKGKYVGCPVSGTNAERIAGVDGMPPCPLWVRHEMDKALEAVKDTEKGKFPGRAVAAWQPPAGFIPETQEERDAELADIRNWTAESPVERDMLDTNAKLFSKMWGFDVYEGVPSPEKGGAE